MPAPAPAPGFFGFFGGAAPPKPKRNIYNGLAVSNRAVEIFAPVGEFNGISTLTLNSLNDGTLYRFEQMATDYNLDTIENLIAPVRENNWEVEWMSNRFLNILKELRMLKRLSLENAHIGPQDMKDFLEALPKGLTLLSLRNTRFLEYKDPNDLNARKLNLANAEHLINILPTLKSLEVLDLSRNTYPGDTLIRILSAAPFSLHTLVLHKVIMNGDLRLRGDYGLSHLEVLDLSETYITPSQLHTFIDSMSNRGKDINTLLLYRCFYFLSSTIRIPELKINDTPLSPENFKILDDSIMELEGDLDYHLKTLGLRVTADEESYNFSFSDKIPYVQQGIAYALLGLENVMARHCLLPKNNRNEGNSNRCRLVMG